LNASQRINIKRAIVTGLAPKGQLEIDLILGEFGLPTWNSWDSEGTESYILASMREASDDQLHGIAAHLGVGVDPAGPSTEGLPRFWAPEHFRLFITHRSEDKKRAAGLQTALKRYCISSFVAHADIEITKKWQDEIESALRTMDALLAIFSPDFRESEWTDQEVGFALGRGTLVVPLCVDGAIPHGFLRKHQGLLARGMSVDDVATAVFDTLRKSELTERPMVNALVGMFENSISYAAARDNMKLLEEVPALDQSQLKRIHDASEANGQIHDNVIFPSTINALLRKHGYTGALLSSAEDVPF